MGSETFWTAFGAVGTTIGSFITAATACLAYKQYKLSKTAKLNISVKQEIVTRSNSSIREEFIKFEFINSGIIDLFIDEIAIKSHEKYFRIENFLEVESTEERKKFPLKVTKEHIVSAKLSTAVLQHLKREVLELEPKSKYKLWFIFVDGNGKERKKRILC